jgi:ubiquinone/menaquinone biosynthesis C-methylase UbiE
MRYDWTEEVGVKEFSRGFYEEIDRRFFSDVWTYMPWKRTPFEQIAGYEDLKKKSVLEIGVGNGSAAAQLAARAGRFTGIDLTAYAVKSTSRRFKVFGLPGEIKRMDAEKMTFPDRSFDRIWTWGVIHHSSNTRRILEEMHRTLKKGGSATVMVYYRNWWNYYFVYGFYYGILRGDLFRTRSLAATLQRWTDGAIARYYTAREWKKLVGDLFEVKRLFVCGSKSTIVPIPPGRIKNFLMRIIPDAFTRFLSNRCRMGTFLVTVLVKK